MNREIKFRGKDKENGKWRIGDLIRMEYFVAGEDGKIYIGDFERSIPYEVLPETTGQFTGLYDKNKVPIYERRYSEDKRRRLQIHSRIL